MNLTKKIFGKPESYAFLTPKTAIVVAFWWFIGALCMYSAHPVSAVQSDALKDAKFFLNLGVNTNSHSVNERELANAIENVSAELTRYDSRQSGFSLGAKALFSNHIFLEAGYNDFGDANNIWQIDTVSSAQALSNVQSAMPRKGNGPFVGIGYRYPLTDSFYLQSSAIAQHWKQNYTTFTQSGAATDSLKNKRSGTSLGLGLGLGVNINDSFNVSLNATRVNFKDDYSNVLSLNLEWRFDELLQSPRPHTAKPSSVTAPSIKDTQDAETSSLNTRQSTVALQPVVESAVVAQALVQKEQAKLHDDTSAQVKIPESVAQKDLLYAQSIIYYRSGSHYLNASDKQRIATLVEAHAPGQMIYVIGSADTSTQLSGQARLDYIEINKDIAFARASGVKEELIKQGIDSHLIFTDIEISNENNRFARKTTIDLGTLYKGDTKQVNAQQAQATAIVEQNTKEVEASVPTGINDSAMTVNKPTQLVSSDGDSNKISQNISSTINRFDIIYYAINSSYLNTKDKQVVREFFNAYEAGQMIELIGSADGVAKALSGKTLGKTSKQYNQALANKRINGIKALLVDLGVPATDIKTSVKLVEKTDKFSRKVTMKLVKM